MIRISSLPEVVMVPRMPITVPSLPMIVTRGAAADVELRPTPAAALAAGVANVGRPLPFQSRKES